MFENPFIEQFQITSYALNLGYKIRISSEGDWIYPCREALNLFKGSSNVVSLRNNELLDNIFKVLALELFEEDKNNASPSLGFVPCDNINRQYFIAKHGACRGFCRVQTPSLPFELDTIAFHLDTITYLSNIDSTYFYYIPPIGIISELLEGMEEYTLNINEDSIQIALLDSLDLFELDFYIQTHINNFIIEPEFQLHTIGMVKNALMIMIPVDCTSDYCCIYEIGLCVDNDGNTQVIESRTGNIPNECTGTLPLTSCPNGVPYPCTESCGN